jgi:hypothetical protein
MFFNRKVQDILKKQAGEKAIMAIDNLLTPIFYSNPQKLTEEEKVIVYIEELEREVNNGGFSQFFFNSSGDYADEVIQSLRIIGSTRFLSLMESAIAQFPNSLAPKDTKERRELLKQIGDKADPIWNNLDSEFYLYDENIYALMRTYMTNHIKKFR